MAFSSIPSFATNDLSMAKLPGSSRDDLKNANAASDTIEVKKVESFPTEALGLTLTPREVDSGAQSADYYRFGKIRPNSTYEIHPRVFSEADDERKTASIRIFGQGPKDATEKDLIPAYTKFFLESVSEGHAERMQIIETFGQFYTFFFGERPPVYSFRGQLVNARNANWVSDFGFMYERYLRGTRCVELNAKAILTYGGRQIEGFLMNFNTITNAAIEGAVGLEFQVVVTDKKFLSFSDDLGVSTEDNGTLIQDDKLIALLDQIAGIKGQGSSDPKASEAHNAGKGTAQGSPANRTRK